MRLLSPLVDIAGDNDICTLHMHIYKNKGPFWFFYSYISYLIKLLSFFYYIRMQMCIFCMKHLSWYIYLAIYESVFKVT